MLSQNRQRQYSQVFAQQFSTLVEIRSIVIEEVIPKVLDEIREKGDNELDDDELKWLQEWVDDLGQVFRIYKRNDYDVQNTLSAMHQTLLWRIRNLRSVPTPTPSHILRFIPHPLSSLQTQTTYSTHPILYFSLGNLTKFASTAESLDSKVEDLKDLLINTYELARMYMRDLDEELQRRTEPDESSDEHPTRILQFALMVDVRGAGMIPNLGKAVASWLAQDLAPNFPGVCGSVYVVNYSWTYSTLWAFIKRFLSQKVLERISFPSNSELLEHFPSESLLQEHGGLLPAFSPNHDAVLEKYYPITPCPTVSSESENFSTSGSILPSSSTSSTTSDLSSPPSAILPLPEKLISAAAQVLQPAFTLLDAYSPLNPYYGYPAILHHRPPQQSSNPPMAPVPVHSQRRWRDLLKTLAYLYMIQLRKGINHCIRLLQARLLVLHRSFQVPIDVRLTQMPGAISWFTLISAILYGLMTRMRRLRNSRSINGRALLALLGWTAARRPTRRILS